MKKFTGMGVAMVTPFKSDGAIDFNGLQKLTEHLCEGADYLVVQGTTGESATLSAKEKETVLNFVLEVNNGRLPIIYGIGGNDTAKVIRELQNLSEDVDGILSVSPYYNKPTQEGIFEHYKAISSATDLPIILYNVPGRTSSNVLAKTTIKAAENIENIVAVKEASGDLEQIMEIIDHRPENFTVLSGDDLLTLPILSSGGDGVISVIGNAFPKEFTEMTRLSREGKLKEARSIHYSLMKLTQLIFREGNPAGIKELLRILGICENHVRLPLVSASKELSQDLEMELQRSGLMKEAV